MLVALFCAHAEAKMLTVGVLDFDANGTSKELATAATGVVAHELNRLDTFRVVTSELLRDLLALDRQQQLLGCSTDSCMTEIGTALGMDLLVSGKVSRVKGKGALVALELSLADVGGARQAGSELEAAESEAALIAKIPSMVVRLLSKVLAQHSGQLLLVATEAGATVKLNGRIVGTTPLLDPLTVPGGPQRLLVEKEGFVSHEREIRIAPGQLTQESVAVVPSPDFVASYEARNGRLRFAAWSTAGIAVAAAAAGSYLVVRAGAVYGSAPQPGTFLFHRARILEGFEVEGDVDHRVEALRLKGEVDTFQSYGVAAVGLGAAAALASGIFWLVGDDPGAYRQFRRPPARVSAWLSPASSGAALALDF